MAFEWALPKFQKDMSMVGALAVARFGLAFHRHSETPPSVIQLKPLLMKCSGGAVMRRWYLPMHETTWESRRAVALLDTGLGVRKVARQIGCSPMSVSQLRVEVEAGGLDALRPKPPPGRPRG